MPAKETRVIDYQIEAAEGGKALLRVRCAEGQVAVLKRLLAGAFPGRVPTLIPEVDQKRFTHRCLVPESEKALRQHWAGWQMQLFLAAKPNPPRLSGTQGANTATTSDRPAAPPAKPAQPPTRPEAAEGKQRSAPPTGKPGWAARPNAAPVDRLEQQLAHLASLPAATRLSGLEELAASPASVTVSLLLARTLGELGDFLRAASIYEAALPQVLPAQRTAARVGLAEALLLAGRTDRLPVLIGEDEPEPRLRGLLGAALARLERYREALPHLAAAWDVPSGRNPLVALALARSYWQTEDYEAAADPYLFVFDQGREDLEAPDYLALAELAELGAFGEHADDCYLTCIEQFCRHADPATRAGEPAHRLVGIGLDLARRVGTPARLFHAYQRALDDLLRRHSGTGNDLVDLVDQMSADYHGGRLDGSGRFDLLEEVQDSLHDYPQRLRAPLIASFEDLLDGEIRLAEHAEAPFPPYVKDLVRALERLRSKSANLARYKHALRAQRAQSAGETSEEAPPNLAGKRVALVGGHDRTRHHARAQIIAWGGLVDEVAPPTTGRISEREILDRVRASDLIVLIVTYMGHDMSTIVSNLKHREVLRGAVLPVDCRGVSGVCRAIRDWAEGVGS